MPMFEESLLDKPSGTRKVHHDHLLIHTVKWNILKLEINVLNQIQVYS